MIWNALNAYEVEYKNDLVADKDGKLSSKSVAQDKSVIGIDDKMYKVTLLGDKYETTSKTAGIVTAVKEDDKGTFSVTVNTLDDKGLVTRDTKGYNKVTKDYSGLMGQKVDVMIKDGKNGKSSEILGVYSNEDSKVIATGIVGDLDTVSNNNDKIKLGDTEYKLDTTASVQEFNAGAYTTSDLRGLAAAPSGAQAAYAIKLIDNDGNGKVDNAVVTPFDVAKVTYVGSSSVTLSNVTGANIGNIDTDKVQAYDGMAKDDYVIVYRDTKTVSGDYELQKITPVTGKVTAVKASDTKGNIDGTWYEKVAGENFTLNDTIDVYAVNGYSFFLEVSDSGATSAEVVFVDDTEVKTGLNAGLNAKMYKTTGDVVEAKISRVDGKKVVKATGTAVASNEVTEAAAAASIKNHLFTYTMDGDKYELKSITNNNKCGFKGQTEVAQYGDKNLTQGTTTLKFADDGVFFVKGNDDTKVMSGKQVTAWGDATQTMTTGSQAMYSETNGFKYAQVGALVLSTDIPDASGDIAYGYLIADVEKINEGNTEYLRLTMWTEQGEKTFKVKASDSKTSLQATEKKGAFVSYNVGDGEYINDVDLLTNYGAVTAYTEGSTDINLLTADNGTIEGFKNALADNAKIIYVNTKTTKGINGGSITVAGKDSNDQYIANVVYVIAGASDDNANKVTWLFVDTNNDLDKVLNPVDQAKADKAAQDAAEKEAKEKAEKEAAEKKAVDTKKVDDAIAALQGGTVEATQDATSVKLSEAIKAEGVTIKVQKVEAGNTNVSDAELADGTLTGKTTGDAKVAAGTVKVTLTVTAGEVAKDTTLEFTVTATA